MSNRFKFRIWNKVTNKFVQNTAGTHCFSNWTIGLNGEVADFVASVDHEGYSKSEQNFYFAGTKVVKECPYVIQQYTGFKDKAGHEIFEGDILDDGTFAFPVVWNQKFGQFTINEWEFGVEVNSLETKVVGNIFENQDLLKV